MITKPILKSNCCIADNGDLITKLHINVDENFKILNFYYTRDITPKRVTSFAAHFCDLGLDDTASKKRCSDGEHLATLRPIRPAWELKPEPSAPLAVSLTTTNQPFYVNTPIIVRRLDLLSDIHLLSKCFYVRAFISLAMHIMLVSGCSSSIATLFVQR